MNKLITDTMNNAADIMDAKITRNQEIINSLSSPADKFQASEAIEIIRILRSDNEKLHEAVKLIREGVHWV